jgi:hypothetical protein
MGLFCVNMHFRSTDDKTLSAAVKKAVKKRGATQFRVLPAKSGWTSLYEEQASQQDDRRIHELMRDLSGDLQVAAIAFMVHDSDIACYWLYENGELLDEYNSCPAYFEDDATGDEPPSGGRPDLLVRYCRPGVAEEQIVSILGGGESVFAESVVEQLAEALGIDVERALADYRDGGGGGPRGRGDSDDDDGDDDGDGPQLLSMRQGLAARLTEMLGGARPGPDADPQASALVQAAVKGEVAEIDRLLAAGAAVDAEAPASLPGVPGGAVAQIMTGPRPQIPMTPLMAAVAHKQRSAAERLLDRGADPNRVHQLFGTTIHAAAGGGELELLKLLIARGGDVNAQNAHKLTPLHVIRQSRATTERLAQAQEMMKSMGMKVPGLVEQLAKTRLPTEGWDACERLLKQHGAV